MNKWNKKIAVIDSGINLKSKFIDQSKIIAVDMDHTDRNGHGTGIIYLIQQLYADAQIYVLKIYDIYLKTTTRKVIDSIKWCVDNDIKLINLSTSIVGNENYAYIKEICDWSYKQGCIIVASAHNFGIPCLPSYLPNVYGVGISFSNDPRKIVYRREHCIQLYAKGINIEVPNVNDRLVKTAGTSYATAISTGNIASIAAETGIESVDRVLQQNQPEEGIKIIECNNYSFNVHDKKSSTF